MIVFLATTIPSLVIGLPLFFKVLDMNTAQARLLMQKEADVIKIQIERQILLKQAAVDDLANDSDIELGTMAPLVRSLAMIQMQGFRERHAEVSGLILFNQDNDVIFSSPEEVAYSLPLGDLQDKLQKKELFVFKDVPYLLLRRSILNYSSQHLQGEVVGMVDFLKLIKPILKQQKFTGSATLVLKSGDIALNNREEVV